LKFQPHVNFVFDLILVPYTITDHQAPENLQYIPRGAKWNDVKNVLFSNSKCKKNQLKHKTKCVTDILLTDRSSSMKEYIFHYVVIT